MCNFPLLRGPKPTKNLLEIIEQDRDLTKFAEALRSSELDSRLSGSDFFTVFAPSDEFIGDDNDDVDRQPKNMKRSLKFGDNRTRSMSKVPTRLKNNSDDEVYDN